MFLSLASEIESFYIWEYLLRVFGARPSASPPAKDWHSRWLRESVNESEVERQERTASEIDRFFGGWSEDPRTTDEIMQQIRDGRTANTFPQQ